MTSLTMALLATVVSLNGNWSLKGCPMPDAAIKWDLARLDVPKSWPVEDGTIFND